MIVEKSIRIAERSASYGLFYLLAAVSFRTVFAIRELGNFGVTEWASQPTVPVISVVFARTGFGKECQPDGAVKC